jgi:hypothetical protein
MGYVLILTKMGLGYFLGDFSKTHLVTLVTRDAIRRKKGFQSVQCPKVQCDQIGRNFPKVPNSAPFGKIFLE